MLESRMIIGWSMWSVQCQDASSVTLTMEWVPSII